MCLELLRPVQNILVFASPFGKVCVAFVTSRGSSAGFALQEKGLLRDERVKNYIATTPAFFLWFRKDPTSPGSSGNVDALTGPE